MTMNCANSPMKMSLGRISTGLKSLALSVNPMPNITTPSIGVMHEVLIQSNDLGKNRASAVTTTTKMVMLAAMNDDIL